MDLKSDNFNIEKVRSSSKQPPAVVEVEKEIIGAMLLDNEAIPKVFEILKSDSFFDPKHKVIFQSIQALYEANEPVDTVTLYEELKKQGKVEESGGVTYVSKLAQDVSSAANVDYHSRIVLEKWILRKLISTSLDVASSAFDAKEDVFDLLDEAETKLFDIT